MQPVGFLYLVVSHRNHHVAYISIVIVEGPKSEKTKGLTYQSIPDVIFDIRSCCSGVCLTQLHALVGAIGFPRIQTNAPRNANVVQTVIFVERISVWTWKLIVPGKSSEGGRAINSFPSAWQLTQATRYW